MSLLQKVKDFMKESAERNYKVAVEALINERESGINDIYFWDRLTRHYRLRRKVAQKKGIDISDYVKQLEDKGIVIN